MQPINEVIASELCEYAGISHVRYALIDDGHRLLTACPCMVDSHHEMIEAGYFMFENGIELSGDPAKKLIGYRKALKKAGISDTDEKIDQMIMADILMGNPDKHASNFGLIRNSDTLEYEDVCPLFDFGKSFGFPDGNHISGLTWQPLEDDVNFVSDRQHLSEDIYSTFIDIVKRAMRYDTHLSDEEHKKIFKKAEKQSKALKDKCYHNVYFYDVPIYQKSRCIYSMPCIYMNEHLSGISSAGNRIFNGCTKK